MGIRKAVIPAAGLGTRFLPATKAQPKEMLPIVDKPVIQYIVEEAAASGIEQVVIITGQSKRAIEDHFDRSFELEYRLAETGKKKQLEEIKHVAELVDFVYVRQPQPLGLHHQPRATAQCDQARWRVPRREGTAVRHRPTQAHAQEEPIQPRGMG